jgi:hypothetical protein
VYVLAFEEDGYGRDVTRRYARQYAAKVAKIQGGQKPPGRKQAWWERVVDGIRRPYRLVRVTLCTVSVSSYCLVFSTGTMSKMRSWMQRS